MKATLLPGYKITGTLKEALETGHDLTNLLFDGSTLIATTTNPLAILEKKNWTTIHRGKASGNLIPTKQDQELFNKTKHEMAVGVAWLFIDKNLHP